MKLMNKKTFIDRSASLGYANKKQAAEWCELHPKENYAEEDYENLFRWCETRREKHNGVWHTVNGCRTTKSYSHKTKM